MYKQNVCKRYHEGKNKNAPQWLSPLHVQTQCLQEVPRGQNTYTWFTSYGDQRCLQIVYFIHFGGLSRQSTLTQTTRGDTSGAQKTYSSSKGSSSRRGPSTEMRFAEMVFSLSVPFSYGAYKKQRSSSCSI